MAEEFWFKSCQVWGPRGAKPSGACEGAKKWSQRDRVTHSRLGLPQIHASNSVQHQQVYRKISSGTTITTGFPAPVTGGSREPQIPSKIPSQHSSTAPPQWSPAPRALTTNCPHRMKTSGLPWTELPSGPSGFWTEGLCDPSNVLFSPRAVFRVQSLTSERT